MARRTLLATVLVLGGALSLTGPAQAQITSGTERVTNGGFESPAGTSFAGEPTGWTSLDVDNVVLGNWGWRAAEGRQSVDLSGGIPGYIYQDVPTPVPGTYVLRFIVGANGASGPTNKTMTVSVGGVQVASYDIPVDGIGGFNWRAEEIRFTTTVNPTRVRFDSTTNSSSGNYIDAVSVRLATEFVSALQFDFNDVWSEQTLAQYQSGLSITALARLPYWEARGVNVSHGLRRNPSDLRDWALMVWSGDVGTAAGPANTTNIYTSRLAYPVNRLGMGYTVSFDVSPAVFQANWQATGADDRLRVQLVNAAGAIVAQHDVAPGVWSGAPNWQRVSFQYTGDGTGDLKTVITAAVATGRFAGAIDNLNVSAATTPLAPSVTLTATPTTAQPGQTIQLSWSAANAVNCRAAGQWTGDRSTVGVETSAPLVLDQNRFALTCEGPDGSATAQVEVSAAGGLQTQFGVPTGSLLPGGGFEVEGATCQAALSGTVGSWTVASGTVGLVGQACGPQADEGQWALDLSGTAAGVVYQDVTTVVGRQYDLVFSTKGNTACLNTEGARAKTVRAFIGPYSAGRYVTRLQPGVASAWQRQIVRFQAWNATTRIQFDTTDLSACGGMLDRVAVLAVPVDAESPAGLTPLQLGDVVLQERFDGALELQWSGEAGTAPAIGGAGYGFSDAASVGPLAYSFTTVDQAQVARLNQVQLPQRTRLALGTVETVGEGVEVELRLNTLQQGGTNTDGIMQLWLVNTADPSRFAALTMYLGCFSACPSWSWFADTEWGSASLSVASNTWYRLRISAMPGAALEFAIWNDAGTVRHVHAYSTTTLAELGENFRVVLSQSMGAPGNNNYSVLAAVDHLRVRRYFQPVPVVTPVVTGTQGGEGWYTSDVALRWQADTRGLPVQSVVGCVPDDWSTDFIATTFDCQIQTSGGTGTSSVTLKRDATAPSASYQLAPLPNAQGWHAAPVTVSFDGSDAMSGLASCTADDSIASEGADQSSVEGQCTDKAGNTSTAVRATGINLDMTDPVVTATPTPEPNAAGWNNTGVAVALTATDALSGIALEGCDAPVDLLSNGAAQSASGSCRDRAGNEASATASGIDIDLQPPTAVATATPLPNAAGWHNAPMTVSFDGADALSGSGLAACTASAVVSTDVTGRLVSGSCTDVAGSSSAPAAVTVNLDQLAPGITVTVPGAAASYAQGSALLANYACSDERSGVASCEGSVSNGAGISTAATGTYVFNVSAADNAGNLATRAVTYTVVPAAPAYALQPTAVAFGSQPLNFNVLRTVQLSSTGTAALGITSVTISGAQASQFTQSNDCGSSLAAGAQCTITVQFRATTTGAKSASLVLATNAGTANVALSGTGVVPTYTLSPTSLAFGSLTNTTTSTARAVTVSNTGSVLLPITSIALTGTQANQFAITSACGPTLAAGSNCVVQVVFRPTTAGSKSASLRLTPGGGATARTVSLTGTGVAPSYTVTPTSLAFGTQLRSTTSAARNVVVANTSTVVLPITSIALGGSNANQFLFNSACGAQIPVGGSCAVSVQFRPTSTGNKSARLTITPGAGAAAVNVALSGTGG